MLELKAITKSFDDEVVLNHIDFSIEKRDWVMISGESGSGKTTLLNIMTGLLKCDSGLIKYNNTVVDFKQLNKIRRDDFAIIFQQKNLIYEFSVYNNLRVVTQDDNKINELLIRFHLMDLKNKKITQLSGGQLQKIAIIRSVLKSPKIIFLDEPTGNLDIDSTNDLIEFLKEINKDTAICMITHNQELLKYANKVVNLKNGELEIISCKDNNISSFKDKKSISFKRSFAQLLQFAFWNLKYYYKTYSLGLVSLGLVIMGCIFSYNIGRNIDNVLKEEMIIRDSEFELLVESEEVISKDIVKTIYNETKANKYNLNLNLFDLNSGVDVYVEDKEIIKDMDIKIDSTYNILDSDETVVISSKLADELGINETMKSNIKIGVFVLSSFHEYSSIYWIDNQFRLYEPKYQETFIDISHYHIIDSNENIVYLPDLVIEKLADNNLTTNYSNQEIKLFGLKYTNYEELKEAQNYIESLGTFTTYSVYDNFKGIEEDIDTQFAIFNYSSYIMIFIVILLVILIEFNVNSYKKDQNKILKELGFSYKEYTVMTFIENILFSIIVICFSWCFSSLFIYLFNKIYNIVSFLPQSYIEFSVIAGLPLNDVSWFNISYMEILAQICILTIPIITIACIIAIVKNKYEIDSQ